MRLFLGIEIDESVRSAAAAAAALLKQRLEQAAPGLDARWVAASNLHITLWFIGEAVEARGQAIMTALERPFDTSAFRVELGGLAAFPATGRPRVLWLGVRQGRTALRDLHGEIAGRLAPLGFEREARPYEPHLTLARVKDTGRASGRAIGGVLAGVPAECGTCPVTAVTVFRSRLSPKGATYEPLLRVPLP